MSTLYDTDIAAHSSKQFPHPFSSSLFPLVSLSYPPCHALLSPVVIPWLRLYPRCYWSISLSPTTRSPYHWCHSASGIRIHKVRHDKYRLADKQMRCSILAVEFLIWINFFFILCLDSIPQSVPFIYSVHFLTISLSILLSSQSGWVSEHSLWRYLCSRRCVRWSRAHSYGYCCRQKTGR